jgi:hypothetical protein
MLYYMLQGFFSFSFDNKVNTLYKKLCKSSTCKGWTLLDGFLNSMKMIFRIEGAKTMN